MIPKLVKSKRPEHGAQYVVDEVSKRIQYKFNRTDHARVGRFFNVRPKKGAIDKTINEKYCEYIGASKIYVYNNAWINKVVDQLSTPEGYRRATGREPIVENSRTQQPIDIDN